MQYRAPIVCRHLARRLQMGGPDGQSVGRGKVTYTSTAHANAAVKQLSGWYVHGRTMRVCLWRPMSDEFEQQAYGGSVSRFALRLE